ncbi:MAG: hypothetical protein AAF363_00690 [Bacteroidota bacterium]
MDKLKVYSTFSGDLYIKPSEIFEGDHGKQRLKSLMNSSIYKEIKAKEEDNKKQKPSENDG